jgi:GNAT superfamily N-acetyltransferase
VTITLRDGARVTVRPVRRADAAQVLEGFERMSPESRYRRFLSGITELDPSLLRYLTDVDHADHEALVAIAGGHGVAIARYVRAVDQPDTAEMAISVIDEWQGRGLGAALLTLLAQRAREQGIARFTALTLATNQPMLALLRRLGAVRALRSDGDTVHFEVALSATRSDA